MTNYDLIFSQDGVSIKVYQPVAKWMPVADYWT